MSLQSLEWGGSMERLTEKSELGCPLDVVFKALKQGFVYCCDDFDEDILEKWEVSHFTNYKGLGWCLQNISGVNVNFKHNSYEATYGFKSEVFLLKNYKKTWFLREDKSE